MDFVLPLPYLYNLETINMQYNDDQRMLTEALGIPPSRKKQLNALFQRVTDDLPVPFCPAMIHTKLARHINTAEEAYYMGIMTCDFLNRYMQEYELHHPTMSAN